MMKCWKSDPSHRPTFGCLSADLRMMMKEEEQVSIVELTWATTNFNCLSMPPCISTVKLWNLPFSTNFEYLQAATA